MRAIHLICKWDQARSGRKGLSHDKASGMSRSGQWDLGEAEARSLVGGWLYLHEARAEPSVMGGSILDYEMVTDPTLARPHRVVFTFRRTQTGRDQKWRGRNHAMAHTGTSVDATLPHETVP